MQQLRARFAPWAFVCLSSAAAVAADRAAVAEDLATPRFHAGVSSAAGFGNAGDTWVGGPGVEGALGVRVTNWLSIDVFAMIENCLFCGRANVGGYFEFGMGKIFRLSLGGGVGGLYTLRWGYDPSTASFAFGTVRTGFAVARDSSGELILGAEGNLGSSYAGTISQLVSPTYTFVGPLPPGTITGGARLYFGLETL
jgi:hypothetical protein